MPETISLDAKQDPVLVIDRTKVTVARSDRTVPCQNANAVLVDVICEGGYTGTVVIYGNNGRSWLEEADPNSSKAVSASTRFVVLNVSQVVTAGISAIVGSGDGGITVSIVPFIAAASTNVIVTGSTAVDVAKYGGSNVGADNGLHVRPGNNATFDVADRASRLAGRIDMAASTPTLYTVTLTDADTEYPLALPGDCRGFDMQARGSVDIRFSFETGHVAAPTGAYATMKADSGYSTPQIWQGASPSTVYLASSTPGTVVELVAWR